jgi:hypothetical protein
VNPNTRLARTEGIDEPYSECLGHASGYLGAVQPDDFGSLCGCLRGPLTGDGVPDAQVAAWAGHSVEMLRRVYAGRAEGLEGIWITRMSQTLPREDP